MDASQREKYYQAYFSEQAVYSELLAKYNASLTKSQKQLIKTKREELINEIEKRKYVRTQRKKANELDRPKRPTSAFFKFLEQRADRRPDENYYEYLRRKSTEWKALSESEQEAFKEPAHLVEKYK